MSIHRASLSAPAAFFLQEGAAALAFGLVFTIQAVYLIRDLGLTPLHLVLVGTVLEATCFLMEIPTGVIADRFGRRLSVIVGFAFLTLSFALLALTPGFAGVLVTQVISGLGYTCLSGAQSAWLTDEVGEAAVGPLFVRGAQIEALGGAAGILLSAALGSVGLPWAIAAGAATLLALTGALILGMPERGWTPPDRPVHLWNAAGWRDLTATLRDGVRVTRSRPALRALMIVALLYGASTETLDRLWQFHLIDTFALPGRWGLSDAAWFALIALAGKLIGAAVAGAATRLKVAGPASAARLCAGLTLIGVLSGLAFAWAGAFEVALLSFLIGGAARGLYSPLYATWLNQGLDSRVRATVLSIASQVDALGQVAGGPLLGWLGSVVGVRPALAVSAALRVPLLWLFRREGAVTAAGAQAQAEGSR